MVIVVASKEALIFSHCWERYVHASLVREKEPGILRGLIRTLVWTLSPDLLS